MSGAEPGLGRGRTITRHTLIALAVGGVGGVALMVFLLEFDRIASTNAFCTSCHSMTYAQEYYRRSVHYSSPSGVRAACGDCHVSPGVFAATWDHLLGARDLFKQLFGPDYDDPAVNALHLPDAAFSTRDWFRRTDSATCKRCHSLEAIQGKRADTAAIHRDETRGKTCVDCHYNLVHRQVPDRTTFKREAWNRMVEEQYGLAAGTAARLLGDREIP